MTLIKDIATLKKFINFNANSRIESLAPSIEQACEQFLQPYLGDEIIAALQILVDGGSLTGIETTEENLNTLLPLVQKALAFYAVVDFIPEGEVQISGVGIHTSSTDRTKPASERQVNELKKLYLRKADFFTDKLLEYLEKNKDNYPEWSENSTVFDYAKDVFIQDSIEFSKCRDIGKSRRTFMSIRNYMLDVQETFIKNEMGAEFYGDFKEKFMDDELSADEKKLLPYIKSAIANFAFYEALPVLNFTFEAGTVQITSYVEAKSNKTADNILGEIRVQSKEMGEKKLIDLTEYLKANYETYPLYEYVPEEDDSSQYNVHSIKNDATKKHFIGF